MFKKLKMFCAAVVGVLGLAFGVGEAMAQQAAVDVSDIVEGLSNQSTPMTSIFVAGIGLAVVAAAFHWIRRALGK